jgi:hypothetical protein
MSDSTLERIEKAINQLALQQDEFCTQLGALEARLAKPAAGGAAAAEVIGFLDQFRAGEALGEASVGAWIEVSGTACLKGGLRTIQCREGMHARLLEERIRELGAKPKAEISAAVREAVMAQVSSTETTDLAKLDQFLSQFPDVDAALQPIHDLADRLDDDPETQSLLRTIAQDERATLEFLHGAKAQLG